MSNLFASLNASSGALTAFDRSLEVTQENVNNASTAGYAKQSMSLQALPFQPSDGLAGGVRPGDVQSARNQYADQNVRSQLQSLGYFDQKTTSLSALQNEFDISGNTGVYAALNGLLTSFSAWSANPNDSSARQSVLDGAKSLAQSFQTTAAALGKASSDTDQQIRQTVDRVNQLAAQLSAYNKQKLTAGQPDAGLDAKVTSTLEDLSQYGNFDTLQQADGTVTVLMGGQTPLVMGDRSFALSVDTTTAVTAPANPNAAPPARIRGSDGSDITSQLSQGNLGALLEVRNQVIPSLIGDANQTGDLNRLAQAVADRVNGLLQAGYSSDGPPPVSGVPLFTHTSDDATSMAKSLAVDPNVQASQLAAIDPGPPEVANGTALKLANLASPATSADQIDGQSFVAFYGGIAAQVGNEVSTAQDNQTTQQQVEAQARSLRDQLSGVSLDEEAVHLMEFQRAYQATSKMITVLDTLTQTTIDMVQ